jgi:hypothetical protein
MFNGVVLVDPSGGRGIVRVETSRKLRVKRETDETDTATA